MPSTHECSTVVPLNGEPPTLTTARELIQPALRAAVGQLDPRVAEIAGYHLGWLDAEGRPTSADAGKMLRGTLVLLSTWACGAEPEHGLPGAVAVELVHNFSLLHDDVMDGDEQRRHRPAVWTVFGTPAAILVGDALLTLAFGVLSDPATLATAKSAKSVTSAASAKSASSATSARSAATSAVAAAASAVSMESAEPAAREHVQAARQLSSVMQRLCSGQMSDLDSARRSAPTPPPCAAFPRCPTSPPRPTPTPTPSATTSRSVTLGTGSTPSRFLTDAVSQAYPSRLSSPPCPTLARCLATAADKTAALVSGACAIGAILAAAPPPIVAALARFGEHVGLAFQLTDDLLGIWGDPVITGKPVMSDLRARRKTIPVAAALHASTAGARRLAELLAQERELTDDEAAFAAELVEDAGGRTWTEAEVGRQLDAAEDCLAPFGPGSPQHAEFMAVAELVMSRNR